MTATDESSSRFRREARILAQMDHPHVVTVFDYREHDQLRLLVMELLTGGTFADRRAAGMSLETAIASTLAAASGLHHAHEQGILHRDVKPENLMFDRRGTLKVTDFGIARVDVVDATVIDLTHAGQFFGTPAYVSPEQAGHTLGDGRVPIGAASDQYSLAAVLYEALCGQLTHDATGGAVALCTRRMNESARPLRTLVPDIPIEVEAVVMKALARDPMLRYATVEDFAVALGRRGNRHARSRLARAFPGSAPRHGRDRRRRAPSPPRRVGATGAAQRSADGNGDVRVHRRRGIGDVVEGRPGRDADGDGAPRHVGSRDRRIGRGYVFGPAPRPSPTRLPRSMPRSRSNAVSPSRPGRRRHPCEYGSRCTRGPATYATATTSVVRSTGSHAWKRSRTAARRSSRLRPRP